MAARAKRTSVSNPAFRLTPLTSSIGFLTRVVQIQINDRLRLSGKLNISPAGLSLLRLVGANPGIRQVDAAQILLIHESNMAILINGLVRRRLIERRSTPGRKRGGLSITKSGRQECKQAETAESVVRTYAAVLSEKEHQRLIKLLSRLYEASLPDRITPP